MEIELFIGFIRVFNKSLLSHKTLLFALLIPYFIDILEYII
jgi:hypothetical protein